MDSMDLEREKGITIRAKNAAFKWKDYHVNIVDTPGHADFGGEVERIMKMIDGVLLVVDAHDGPQAQTKFVLRKALENGAKPIVVINKIDRENARPHKVLDMVFELFVELNATDEQLDFPVIYASARSMATRCAKLTRSERDHGAALRGHHQAHPAAAKKSDVDYFQFLVSNLDYSDYLGRIAYGRIVSGRVKVGQSAVCFHNTGKKTPRARNVTALFSHEGLAKVEVENASAGRHRRHLRLRGRLHRRDDHRHRGARCRCPSCDIDPPTITMKICINDGPLAGREGKLLTARQVRERLIRETRTNVSILVSDTDTAGHFEIKARGEMQIAILVEQMRREGFEILVSRPEVIFQRDEDGTLLEPYRNALRRCPQRKPRRHPAVPRRPQSRHRQHGAQSAQRHVAGRHSHPRPDRLRDRPRQRHQRPRHHVSTSSRNTARTRATFPRRGNGVLVAMEGGHQHRLLPRYHPGTRPPFHRARRQRSTKA